MRLPAGHRSEERPLRRRHARRLRPRRAQCKLLPGQIRTQDGRCVCPRGTELRGTAASADEPPPPRQCTLLPGQIRLQDGRCVCPRGTSLVRGACRKDEPPQCRLLPGQIRLKDGRCVCPRGTSLVRGACRKDQPPQCTPAAGPDPAARTDAASARVAPNCSRGACRPVQVDCPKGTALSNGNCVNDPASAAARAAPSARRRTAASCTSTTTSRIRSCRSTLTCCSSCRGDRTRSTSCTEAGARNEPRRSAGGAFSLSRLSHQGPLGRQAPRPWSARQRLAIARCARHDDQHRRDRERHPASRLAIAAGSAVRDVGLTRGEGEHRAHHRRAGDEPEIARQVEQAGDDAPLVRRDIAHDRGVVGRLEQRVAGGDDDDRRRCSRRCRTSPAARTERRSRPPCATSPTTVIALRAEAVDDAARPARRSARRRAGRPTCTSPTSGGVEPERARQVERPDHQRRHHHRRDQRAHGEAGAQRRIAEQRQADQRRGDLRLRRSTNRPRADSRGQQQGDIERAEAAARRPSSRAHRRRASARAAACRRCRSRPAPAPAPRRSAGRAR